MVQKTAGNFRSRFERQPVEDALDFGVPITPVVAAGTFAIGRAEVQAVEMPVQGGMEAAVQLRQRAYGGAILALTGHSAASVRAQALAAGCNDLLSKPVSRAQLHAALERALRAPFGAAGTRP